LAGRQPQRFNVERQFNLKRTPNALGMTKPMPLTGKGKQDVPNAPAIKRLGHDLSLNRRHHRDLQPMHQQHRPGDPIHGMQRGASPIGGHRLGIGANQPVELVGVELGSLLAEGLQIGNTEPAATDGEAILRGERTQSRDATGAFAAEHQPPPIHLPRLDQETGRSQAVGHVGDAPLAG
jgi:hypothetical protein